MTVQNNPRNVINVRDLTSCGTIINTQKLVLELRIFDTESWKTNSFVKFSIILYACVKEISDKLENGKP